MIIEIDRETFEKSVEKSNLEKLDFCVNVIETLKYKSRASRLVAAGGFFHRILRKSGFPDISDLDIYVSTRRDYEKCSEILSEVSEKTSEYSSYGDMNFDVSEFRLKNSPIKKIQIINYKTNYDHHDLEHFPRLILNSFDITLSKCAFDGNQFYIHKKHPSLTGKRDFYIEQIIPRRSTILFRLAKFITDYYQFNGRFLIPFEIHGFFPSYHPFTGFSMQGYKRETGMLAGAIFDEYAEKRKEERLIRRDPEFSRHYLSEYSIEKWREIGAYKDTLRLMAEIRGSTEYFDIYFIEEENEALVLMADGMMLPLSIMSLAVEMMFYLVNFCTRGGKDKYMEFLDNLVESKKFANSLNSIEMVASLVNGEELEFRRIFKSIISSATNLAKTNLSISTANIDLYGRCIIVELQKALSRAQTL